MKSQVKKFNNCKAEGPSGVRVDNHLHASLGNYVVMKFDEHTKLFSVLTNFDHHKIFGRRLKVIVKFNPLWAFLLINIYLG